MVLGASGQLGSETCAQLESGSLQLQRSWRSRADHRYLMTL